MEFKKHAVQCSDNLPLHEFSALYHTNMHETPSRFWNSRAIDKSEVFTIPIWCGYRFLGDRARANAGLEAVDGEINEPKCPPFPCFT